MTITTGARHQHVARRSGVVQCESSQRSSIRARSAKPGILLCNSRYVNSSNSAATIAIGSQIPRSCASACSCSQNGHGLTLVFTGERMQEAPDHLHFLLGELPADLHLRHGIDRHLPRRARGRNENTAP